MLRRIILSIILVVLLAPAAWAGTIVTIAAEQTVAGPMLTLGTIAEVSGDDEAKIKMLKALTLGAAPKPGSNLVLTRELLAARLAAAGADLSGTTWNMPDNVTITTKFQIVDGARIAAAASELLIKRLNVAEDKRELDLIDFSGDRNAPVGDIKLLAELPYGVRKSGPTIVNVTVSADGRIYEKISLKYNVKVYEDIIIAAKPIASREALTPDNLAYQRTNVARLTGSYYTDINKIIGLNAKRTIAAGTLISDTFLEKPILVKRGSTVTILAYSGDMAISAAGEALQDGTEGQLIRIRNTSSKRIVAAKVVGEGLAQITTIK